MKENNYIKLDNYVKRYLGKSVTVYNNLELRQVIYTFLLSLLNFEFQNHNILWNEKGKSKNILDSLFSIADMHNCFIHLDNKLFSMIIMSHFTIMTCIISS